MNSVHDDRAGQNPAPGLAVLISGGGTTLVNMRTAIEQGRLHASIGPVIASNVSARDRVQARGEVAHLIERKAFSDTQAYSKAIFDLIREQGAELVCLAGFLSLLVIPDDFHHRVLNIYPALLPAFGGKGMYGHHVHEAVLQHGCKVSGCTVHFADNEYDQGPIIVQRTCPVLEGDLPETLARRVFQEECIAYPEAIELVLKGRVQVAGRRTIIRG